DAAAHLVRERLEREALAGGGQCRGERRVDAVAALLVVQERDRLLEAAGEQVAVRRGRHVRRRAALEAIGEAEAVDRVEEEQRAHALVEVSGPVAELLERGALAQELLVREAGDRRLET